MLLVELIKHYAGRHRTDKAILGYLDTEDQVARFDVGVQVEDVSEEWIIRFAMYAGEDHARRVRKVVHHSI